MNDLQWQKFNLTEQDITTLLNYLEDDIIPKLEDEYHCDEKCNDRSGMEIINRKYTKIIKIFQKLKRMKQTVEGL